MPSRNWLLLASCCMTLLIGAGCLLPASQLPSFSFLSFLQWDKLLHLLAFYFLSSWWMLVLPGSDHRWKNHVGLWMACVAYGLLIEFAQSWMHMGRHLEWADLTADALGAALGLILPQFSHEILRISKRHLPFVN